MKRHRASPFDGSTAERTDNPAEGVESGGVPGRHRGPSAVEVYRTRFSGSPVALAALGLTVIALAVLAMFIFIWSGVM